MVQKDTLLGRSAHVGAAYLANPQLNFPVQTEARSGAVVPVAS